MTQKIKPADTSRNRPGLTLQQWGGIASFALPVTLVAAQWIYLTGNLRDAIGPFAYDLADFLYGPVWAASFITAFIALRERIGDHAPRRMSVAWLATALTAGMMVTVAFIRSANRHYHLNHPELNLENSLEVLTVWSTTVSGLTGAGWHFLGWTLILIGSAGWTSGRLPRLLCVAFLVAGVASLFVYLFPELEGFTILLGIIWGAWQGIALLRTAPD